MFVSLDSEPPSQPNYLIQEVIGTLGCNADEARFSDPLAGNRDSRLAEGAYSFLIDGREELGPVRVGIIGDLAANQPGALGMEVCQRDQIAVDVEVVGGVRGEARNWVTTRPVAFFFCVCILASKGNGL